MTSRRTDDGGGLVPASRSVPAVADSSEMREWAEQLVARARSEGVELTGDNGLLTAMVRQVLQTGLNVEMAEHLGYEPYAAEGRGSGNNRNGSYPKTVTTEIGAGRAARCRVTGWARSSRSRSPSIVRRLDGLSGNVISLYAKGMTTGDIQAASRGDLWHRDLAGRRSRRSPTRSSRTCWPGSTGRSIRVYAVLLIDCIVIKIRGTPGREPARLRGHRREPRRRTRRARHVGRPVRR